MKKNGFVLVDALTFFASIITGFLSLFFAIDLDKGITIGGFVLFPFLMFFVLHMVIGSNSGSGSNDKKGDDK